MTTPARKQYLDIKQQHQDAILLYQIGDFFETFDEDAVIAARALNIVLTSRSYGPGEQVPLAGVPVHALDTYTAKLVACGYKVAICEQVSPPGRGLVKREVTRILTPGTLTDPGLAPPLRDNYLAAVTIERDTSGAIIGAGFAYTEVSAGAFACAQWTGSDAADALRAEVQRVSPAEVLVAEREPKMDGPVEPDVAPFPTGMTVTRCPAHTFDREDARTRMHAHFGTRTLAAFGCDDLPLACAAAGAILAYLARMNPGAVRLLTELTTYDTGGFVGIDNRTWRALEITESSHPTVHAGGQTSGGARTLFGVLDQTRTPMGARMLRRLLRQPLKDRRVLERRLDAIDALVSDASMRQRLAHALAGMPDLERLVARLAHGSATARDLHSLRSSLLLAPDVRRLLRRCPALQEIGEQLDPCLAACDLIEQAIADPWRGEERIIRSGFSPALDGLTREVAEARAWIATLESEERQRTGIKSLKVTYNAVFGYAIEVTRPNLDRVPPEYQRKQTLAHAERYVTAELLDHEKIILRAEERILAQEQSLFAEVLAQLASMQMTMRRTAQALAQLDVWLALAEVAVTRRYVRPTFTDGGELLIVGGRHPVVEAALDDGAYIANDTTLGEESDGAGARLALLTGPNMAGKSTYLRQVALIALMAQIGAFVPAQSVRLAPVDRIFTRVGAEDDLAAGLSTFMLEMVETAYILRHATERSLVILDEIGRGTSTHDGLAIARAVIEHVYTDVRARTLFATHYHELAELADCLPGVALWHMAIVEDGDSPVFLHRLEPGPSERSYGVHVASIAGLPSTVVRRARDLLVERPMRVREPPTPYRPNGSDSQAGDAAHTAIEAPGAEHELALALAGLNLADTTPIEALNILFSLQQRALSGLRVGGR